MTSALADRWTLYDRILQRLRYNNVIPFIPRGSVLLDCGCGNGEFLKYLGERISKGYGMDTVIRDVREGQHYTFLQGNLEQNIPLDDNAVNVVTALALLEHLSHPDVFVREVFRVLRPGGSFLLTTPSPMAKPMLEFLAYKLRIISERDIQDHKRYFTSDEVTHLLHHFTMVKIGHFLFGLNTLITAVKGY